MAFYPGLGKSKQRGSTVPVRSEPMPRNLREGTPSAGRLQAVGSAAMPVKIDNDSLPGGPFADPSTGLVQGRTPRTVPGKARKY